MEICVHMCILIRKYVHVYSTLYNHGRMYDGKVIATMNFKSELPLKSFIERCFSKNLKLN